MNDEENVKSRRSKRVANAVAAQAAAQHPQSANYTFGASGHGSSSLAHAHEKHKKFRSGKQSSVDFVKLEMSSLLRYARHYQLNIRPHVTKTELIPVVRKHFTHHPRMRDVDVIAAFLHANQKYLKEMKQIKQPTA